MIDPRFSSDKTPPSIVGRSYCVSSEKPVAMLRQVQHQRKILALSISSPFALSLSKGDGRVFQQNDILMLLHTLVQPRRAAAR
jgi:hypothetical protein